MLLSVVSLFSSLVICEWLNTCKLLLISFPYLTQVNKTNNIDFCMFCALNVLTCINMPRRPHPMVERGDVRRRRRPLSGCFLSLSPSLVLFLCSRSGERWMYFARASCALLSLFFLSSVLTVFFFYVSALVRLDKSDNLLFFPFFFSSSLDSGARRLYDCVKRFVVDLRCSKKNSYSHSLSRRLSCSCPNNKDLFFHRQRSLVRRFNDR